MRLKQQVALLTNCRNPVGQAIACGLARDLASWGIHVNAVAPGFILSSPRAERRWRETRTEEQKQAYLRSVPLGRLGEPDDIAPTVAFLCSDEASYITGVTIDVNGGSVMV